MSHPPQDDFPDSGLVQDQQRRQEKDAQQGHQDLRPGETNGAQGVPFALQLQPPGSAGGRQLVRDLQAPHQQGN